MNGPAPWRRNPTRLWRTATRLQAYASVLLFALATPPSVCAASEPSVEYQVKASYLYNFLQFVEWPQDALPEDRIVVCVFGQNRFGRALQAIEGESARGHTIVVRNIHAPGALDACQLVFLSASERRREAQVLRRLAGQPVLTVGETSGFTDRGGIINLVPVNNTIRFEINQQAAEHNGLKISAQLMQLAVRQ